ncbi:MAG: STAS domain-containing protein [Spirochaetia bacterium]|jgi:anti-anti-sigma factor
MIQVKETASGEIEVLPTGHLAREDMDELAARLEEALARAHGAIALNFQGLKSLSSSAIGKLLHFKAKCDQKGIKLTIRQCSPQMMQLLKMIKFDTLIQMET